MAASDKKEMLVMVLRPTIFRVEANSFEDAKKTITNQLIASGQMKPDAPIEFREMIDYELKNKTDTKEGEMILDNCMGSGSTGVACKNTKRKFIGIEIDEKYYKIAKERINESGK